MKTKHDIACKIMKIRIGVICNGMACKIMKTWIDLLGHL